MVLMHSFGRLIYFFRCKWLSFGFNRPAPNSLPTNRAPAQGHRFLPALPKVSKGLKRE
jgi:hypothetical protein